MLLDCGPCGDGNLLLSEKVSSSSTVEAVESEMLDMELSKRERKKRNLQVRVSGRVGILPPTPALAPTHTHDLCKLCNP